MPASILASNSSYAAAGIVAAPVLEGLKKVFDEQDNARAAAPATVPPSIVRRDNSFSRTAAA
jgi:hypothetical protein